jgi:hypothetical protein
MELHVRNLDRTLEKSRATVTVTAADGQVTTVRPEEENGVTCSDTGLINFYTSGFDQLALGPRHCQRRRRSTSWTTFPSRWLQSFRSRQ